MRVIRVRPSGRAPNRGEIFRGEVLMQPVVDETTSDRHRIGEVTFLAGARTKLHTHSTDQVLVITSGVGTVGTREERHAVGLGDVVVIPAEEPHFHGAADGQDMTHYSILGVGETTVLE